MIALVAGLALLAAMCLPGVALLRRLTRELDPMEEWAYGLPLGAVVSALAILIMAIAIGLTTGLVVAVGALGLLTALFLWYEDGISGWSSVLTRAVKESRQQLTDGWRALGLFPAVVLGLFTARMAFLWATAFTMEPTGLWAGINTVWADWPLHLGDVTAFVYGDNFPPQNTRYVGTPLAYHYLTSITAAAMVKVGMAPETILPLTSFIFTIVIILGIFAFARRLTRDRDVAALTVVLFMLGGGFGWVLTLKALNGKPNPLAGLWQQPWDQSAQDAANFRWPNMFFPLIASQRAHLYGVPLFLLILTLLLLAIERRERKLFVGAGVVAGLLPFAHTSTLIPLAIITPCLFLLFLPDSLKRLFDWCWFFGLWAVLAVPQLYLQQGGQRGETKSIRWLVGWVAPPDPWPWFWIKNLGWFLPLLIIALATRDLVTPAVRRLLWAFMPIFVVCNLIAFRPWDWDNTKMFLFWFLAVCVLVAALLVRAWREHPTVVARTLIVVTVAMMIFSGVLLHLQQALGKEHNLLFSTEELQVAELVRDQTPPHAVFAVGIQHNHPVPALAGRRVVMSYDGWAFAFGLNYAGRLNDLRAIFALAPNAPELLDKYNVDYVVIGPYERQNFHADPAAFAARYPRVIATQNYQIFKVR